MCYLGVVSSKSKTTPKPFHQQVANALRSQIVESPRGTPIKLPPERELSKIHHTSRDCIRRALAVLEAEGLIERTPSRGTRTIPSGIAAYRRTRKTQVIKVVAAWPDESLLFPLSFYGRIYQGIADRSEVAGYTISMRGVGRAFPPLGPNFTPEDPEQVVGVILVGVADERMVRMHADAGYPVVCVDYWAGDPRVDAVVVDCFGEGKLMVDFLLSTGHREFFFVGNVHGSSVDRKREADAELLLVGCQRALRDAGLSIPNERIWWCYNDQQQVAHVADALLGLPHRPTAGIVFRRDTLVTLREALRSRHLFCPGDVSLICKSCLGDQIDAACVKTDAYLLGQYAVEQLLDRAGGKRANRAVLALRSTLHRGPSVRSITM
jgi:DNA-binding LacI/PurR family transcriptional regulator